MHSGSRYGTARRSTAASRAICSQLLTREEVSILHDPLARFVGVEAYEQAGGGVRRDLFSDDNDGFMKDAALLEALAVQRLTPAADAEKAAGAAWVEICPRATWADINAYMHAETMRREPTGEEHAELDALNAQVRKIEDALESAEDDEEITALEEQRGQRTKPNSGIRMNTVQRSG